MVDLGCFAAESNSEEVALPRLQVLNRELLGIPTDEK